MTVAHSKAVKLARKRKVVIRKPRVSEHVEQVSLMQWVRAMQPRFPLLRLLYAVPNGGHRHITVAAKLKAEGQKAGVSDLAWPIPRRGFHGLYLEMKAMDGVLSEAQKDFLYAVADQGYCAAVAKGAKHAQHILEWYAGLSEDRPGGFIEVSRS